MSSEEERNAINLDYAMRLGAKMISGEVRCNRNAMFSPTSMTIALNMVASASQGETLNRFLGFLDAQDIDQLCTRSQTIMSLLELRPATEETAPPVPAAAPPQMEQLRIEPSTSSRPLRVRRKLFSDPESPIPTPTPLLSLENRLPSPAIFMEHAVWVDRPNRSLKPTFVAIAESIYKAIVKNFDFLYQSVKVIAEANEWAVKATNGLIKAILSPSVPLASLCITTTTYFSSAWEVPFRACNSGIGDFHLLTGETIKVPYMIKTDKRFFFRSVNEFKFLHLPYRRDGPTVKGYSMYLFLPPAINGVRDFLLQVGPNLSGLRPESLGLQMESLSLVIVPKFTFAQTTGTRPHFAKDCALFQTEFLRVNEEGSMAVESTEQGFIPVNEEEPAAVEGGAMFVADHPFMFTIVQDVSMLTVLVGVVLNPLDNCKEIIG